MSNKQDGVSTDMTRRNAIRTIAAGGAALTGIGATAGTAAAASYPLKIRAVRGSADYEIYASGNVTGSVSEASNPIDSITVDGPITSVDITNPEPDTKIKLQWDGGTAKAPQENTYWNRFDFSSFNNGESNWHAWVSVADTPGTFEPDTYDTELNDSITTDADYAHVHSHLNNGADTFDFKGNVVAMEIICQGGVDTHFEQTGCAVRSPNITCA